MVLFLIAIVVISSLSVNYINFVKMNPLIQFDWLPLSHLSTLW